jgi:hypothetical protein
MATIIKYMGAGMDVDKGLHTWFPRTVQIMSNRIEAGQHMRLLF